MAESQTFLFLGVKVHLWRRENEVQPLDKTAFLLLHPTLVIIHIL